MFKKSKNIFIYGGKFTAVSNLKKKGKDLWQGKDLWRNHITPGAFHNSRERLEHDPPKCHPETRVAVIEAIIDWIEDGQKTTFIKWLSGAAGAGKSAIAQEIADLCHKSGCLAASFFWSRSAAGRNNEEYLIASLAYQLLTFFPQLRRPVEKAVESDAYIFTRSLRTQMESLIIQPLKEVFPQNQQDQIDNPIVIILDGLDECGTPEAQQYILRLMADSVSKFPIPLCFFIVSRPEKAIRDSFNDQPLLAITDRLVLDEKYHPDDDIRLFLVESFASVKRTHELRSLLPPIWPSNDDIDRLVRKSSGQFIYAATVVKFVKFPRQRPNKQLDIILGIAAAGSATPFAELDALYSAILGLVLKEDLNRALEIISIGMFQTNDEDLTARQIETILSYPRGEFQRVLVDLHSVLHVPAVRSEAEEAEETEDIPCQMLHILHASLRDFLLDSSRSNEFHVDEKSAHECIARHSLQYIRDYSDDVEHRYSCDEIIFQWLKPIMLKASVTTELLLECFDFDPLKWASRLVKGFGEVDDLPNFEFNYVNVVELCQWFRTQEPYVLESLGPTRSLNAHHSRSWEAAVQLVCGEVCRCLLRLYEHHPKSAGDVGTAMTHPEILAKRRTGPDFERVFGIKFSLFNDHFGSSSGPSAMVEFQKYLCDQERAGLYFVDGGRYASLCLRLLQIVLQFQYSTEDDDGDEISGYSDDETEETPDEADDETDEAPDEAEDEADETPDEAEDGTDEETSASSDGEYMPTPDNKKAFVFAISTLPFYLSNADYNPKLSELSRSMLDQKMGEKLPRLLVKIGLLHDAIDLYLQKEPLTSNEPQPNEPQPIKPQPNEPKAVAERIRAGKRIGKAMSALKRMMRRRGV